MLEWIPLVLIAIGGTAWFAMKKLWPVGMICYEKRGGHWILGAKTAYAARRIKKKDGTYNYQLRPYKTKITPPPYESLITDKKGKTWLIAFSPNANSFRAGKPTEITNELAQNLVIGNGGLKLGAVEMPKVTFDTTDQHDIKDFMEDWREKKERMLSGGFLAKWGVHILFLIEAIFIFILVLTLIQGMPEMTNIWYQTAKTTEAATKNLLQAIQNMQGQGLIPGGETKPPW